MITYSREERAQSRNDLATIVLRSVLPLSSREDYRDDDDDILWVYIYIVYNGHVTNVLKFLLFALRIFFFFWYFFDCLQ